MEKEEFINKLSQTLIQRASLYNHNAEEFSNEVCMGWSDYLGIKISIVDFYMLMIIFKIVRCKNTDNKDFLNDSLLDIAGYAAICAESLHGE